MELGWFHGGDQRMHEQYYWYQESCLKVESLGVVENYAARSWLEKGERYNIKIIKFNELVNYYLRQIKPVF